MFTSQPQSWPSEIRGLWLLSWSWTPVASSWFSLHPLPCKNRSRVITGPGRQLKRDMWLQKKSKNKSFIWDPDYNPALPLSKLNLDLPTRSSSKTGRVHGFRSLSISGGAIFDMPAYDSPVVQSSPPLTSCWEPETDAHRRAVKGSEVSCFQRFTHDEMLIVCLPVFSSHKCPPPWAHQGMCCLSLP